MEMTKPKKFAEMTPKGQQDKARRIVRSILGISPIGNYGQNPDYLERQVPRLLRNAEETGVRLSDKQYAGLLYAWGEADDCSRTRYTFAPFFLNKSGFKIAEHADPKQVATLGFQLSRGLSGDETRCVLEAIANQAAALAEGVQLNLEEAREVAIAQYRGSERAKTLEEFDGLWNKMDRAPESDKKRGLTYVEFKRLKVLEKDPVIRGLDASSEARALLSARLGIPEIEFHMPDNRP